MPQPGSLAWFHDTAAPELDYDAMLEAARNVPPGSDGLVFLPYLAGERTPHADPDARGAFCGLSLSHGTRSAHPSRDGRRGVRDARLP